MSGWMQGGRGGEKGEGGVLGRGPSYGDMHCKNSKAWFSCTRRVIHQLVDAQVMGWRSQEMMPHRVLHCEANHQETACASP